MYDKSKTSMLSDQLLGKTQKLDQVHHKQKGGKKSSQGRAGIDRILKEFKG